MRVLDIIFIRGDFFRFNESKEDSKRGRFCFELLFVVGKVGMWE